jgi:hypothetical protein
MNRDVALKIVLALVGLLFLALAYPLFVFVRQEPALSMMLSLYATLGVFLLLAIRHRSASRSLIAFTAWSSLVHAALMWARRGCGIYFCVVAQGGTRRIGGCGGTRRHRRRFDRARAS